LDGGRRQRSPQSNTEDCVASKGSTMIRGTLERRFKDNTKSQVTHAKHVHSNCRAAAYLNQAMHLSRRTVRFDNGRITPAAR
jgi:hypothetical protein